MHEPRQPRDRVPAELADATAHIRELEAVAERLATVRRSLADRYTQICLTGAASDTHRAIAGELAGAFHTLTVPSAVGQDMTATEGRRERPWSSSDPGQFDCGQVEAPPDGVSRHLHGACAGPVRCA
jgi:hypothetical protein